MVDNANEYYETTITDILPVGVILESMDIQIGFCDRRCGITFPSENGSVSGVANEWPNDETYAYECTLDG